MPGKDVFGYREKSRDQRKHLFFKGPREDRVVQGDPYQPGHLCGMTYIGARTSNPPFKKGNSYISRSRESSGVWRRD